MYEKIPIRYITAIIRCQIPLKSNAKAIPIITHIIIRFKLNSRISFLETIEVIKKTKQKPKIGGKIMYGSQNGRYWIN